MLLSLNIYPLMMKSMSCETFDACTWWGDTRGVLHPACTGTHTHTHTHAVPILVFSCLKHQRDSAHIQDDSPRWRFHLKNVQQTLSSKQTCRVTHTLPAGTSWCYVWFCVWFFKEGLRTRSTQASVRAKLSVSMIHCFSFCLCTSLKNYPNTFNFMTHPQLWRATVIPFKALGLLSSLYELKMKQWTSFYFFLNQLSETCTQLDAGWKQHTIFPCNLTVTRCNSKCWKSPAALMI